MTFKNLTYEQDDPVTIVTINRPHVRNAIGRTTHEELVAAWSTFRDDDDALVGILTGAGEEAFCAGGDLKAAFAGEFLSAEAEELAQHAAGRRPGVRGPTRWTDIYKPTIARSTESRTPAAWSGWARCALTGEPPCAVSAAISTEGCASRRSASTVASGRQRSSRAFGASTSATALIAIPPWSQSLPASSTAPESTPSIAGRGHHR